MHTLVAKSFYSVIEATWADVQKVLVEQDADRVDWLRAIRQWRNTGAGMIKTPFSVVAWGRSVPVQSGGGVLNHEYEWPVTVSLVVALGSSEKTENYLMGQLELLSTALFAATMGANNFQVTQIPSVDMSPRSMANEIMNKANLPFQAADLAAVLRYGVTP